MSGSIVIARRHARRCATQALYQWALTTQSWREIHEQFKTRDGYPRADHEHFVRLLKGVIEHYPELDHALTPLLDRPVAEVDPVELAILRLAAFELAHCPDVPWRATINEAVELAKMFGATDSHRYVNGVLDAAARALRPAETAQKRPARD